MVLAEAVRDLDGLLWKHDFVVAYGTQPRHHGSWETATWTRGDRRVGVLGAHALSIGYRIGKLSIDHGGYMSAMLGPGGAHRFPSFTEDWAVSVAAIVHDLREHGADFLTGDGAEFARVVAEAEALTKVRGLGRLRDVERRLRPDR